MPNVSHSEVETYLKCRRAWYYGYGLSLQKQVEGKALQLGTAAHHILAVYYQTVLDAGVSMRAQKAAIPQALTAATAAYDQLVLDGWVDDDTRRMPLARLLFEYYFPNEPLVRNGWVILAVEQTFVLEYDTERERRMPFVVDLIARSPEKKTVVIDHKFVSQFYGDEVLQLLPQIPKYIAGLRALGHKVDEGLYNLVKTYNYKSVPTMDQLLRQLPVRPSNVRVQRTFVEQIDTAEEILSRKEMDEEELDWASFRTANSMVCNGCTFRDLCATELSGGNTKLLIASEFTIRKRRVFDEISEEVDA